MDRHDTSTVLQLFNSVHPSSLVLFQVLSFFDSTYHGVSKQMRKATSQPLSEIEFRSFLNKVGEVVKPKDLRLAVYQRGADPALRKVLWKHLLGIYPQGESYFYLIIRGKKHFLIAIYRGTVLPWL